MKIDVETQATILNALADFWQGMENEHIDILDEEELVESQAWISAVRVVAGMIVDGQDVLRINE